MTRHRRPAAAALGLLAALALGACGAPGVVKPDPNPLPGFTRDISAAHSAVAQTQRQAQADASNLAGSTP